MDHSHPWVRISHGLKKFVTDLNDNEQETSEMQFEDYALKSNARACASRPKAEAKPQRRTLASPSKRTLPIGERKWTYIEPEDYSPVAYPVSKQLSTLLRPGHLPREEDGAISTLVWWTFEEYNGKRRRKQENISTFYWSISTRNSWSPSSSRSFRTQPLWSFTTGQCINSERFLRVHFITQDVQSIYTPSQILDWYQEVKIWAKDREYSSRSWIQWTRDIKILRQLTWMLRVLHGTCMPVSVKRSDQDKDAGENVDADHVRTGRLVNYEQPSGLFTQLEEVDVDFRVSGFPHAVVKQAENFRVAWTREERRESSSSRSSSSWLKTKQHLQPIQWRIISDDSWHGQWRVVWAMRNNSKSAMLSML